MWRCMKYRYVGILVLVVLIWIGYHRRVSIQEKAAVDRLPRNVLISGPHSAKQGLTEAVRIAALWDADCRLQSISMAFGGDVDTDDPGMGMDGIPIPPSGWNYRFFSAAKGWFLDLTIWPSGQCDASSFNGINYLDTKPLPQEYLDSTDALSIAEELYGKQCREQGRLFRLPSQLTTWPSSVVGPRDPVSDRATWQIHYLTTRGNDRVDLYLTLDAVTGDELCAVKSVNSEVEVVTNKYH